MIEINVNNYFIKLPNNLVWTYEEGETPLIQDLNSKTILVLANLMYRCNPLGECYFTLDNLITECGYAPKTGKGKTNDQFKEILLDLEKLNFISNPSVELGELKANTLVKCEINSNVAKNEDGDDEEFFSVFYKDYKKILSIDSKMDKDLMFNIYCYTNSRILHRSDNSINDWEGREAGKAEYTFFTYKHIVKDLKISETTFTENLEVLKENKLIFSDNIGLVADENGNRRSANNVYCVREEELRPALNDSKYYYENNGYVVLGKKTDEGTKKIIGLSGAIKGMKSAGLDTTKHEKKLAKLEKDKEYKLDTRDNKKIIEDIKKLRDKIAIEDVSLITKEFKEIYGKEDISDNKKLLLELERMLKVKTKKIIGKPKNS